VLLLSELDDLALGFVDSKLCSQRPEYAALTYSRSC